jgi:hypothetical protein
MNFGVGVYSFYLNPLAGAVYFGVDALYPGGWLAAFQHQERRTLEMQYGIPNWNPYRGSQGPLN